jgi:hypothetical protein
MLCGSRAGSIGVSRALSVPVAAAPVAALTSESAGNWTCAGDCGTVSVAAALAAKVCAGAAALSRTLSWLVVLACTSATPKDLPKPSARTLTTTRAAVATLFSVKLPSAAVCVDCEPALTLAPAIGWPPSEATTLPAIEPVAGGGGGSLPPPPPHALNRPIAAATAHDFQCTRTPRMSYLLAFLDYEESRNRAVPALPSLGGRRPRARNEQ